MIIGSPTDIDIIERAPDSVLVQVTGVVDVAAVGQLRRHLRRLVDSDAWSVVVDLSAVGRCDYRVLAVLDDARCRLQAAHGRLDVRGLDPESLTGFTEATLSDVLAAYRASPGVAPGHWPGEPGGARVPGMCSDAERRLAQVCVGLVSTAAGGGDADVIGVADRLTEQCARHLGMDATVLLTLPGRGPGALVVASASASGARSVAEVEVGTGEGPGVTCVRGGAPASAPDLAEWTQQWPRYVRAALGHGVRGARALPLRVRAAVPGRGSETIGALGLLSDEVGPMAPADLGVAQAFADLASIALASELGRRAEGRHAAVAGVSAAMADLAIVEQAKGVLAERDRLTMDQAHERLLRHARAHELRLGTVARAVVTGAITVLDPIPVRPVGDRPGR